MTSNTRVVVIGAGLAGVRLARRLGELGVPAVLVGEEEHTPYNRVLLADVLAGRYTPEVIALPAPAEITRARVTVIDRAAREVHCADGSVIAYDTLVLATGSNPVLPPLRPRRVRRARPPPRRRRHPAGRRHPGHLPQVVVRDDRLVGGVLVGELGTVGALARAWEGAEPLPQNGAPLLHLLTNDGGS